MKNLRKKDYIILILVLFLVAILIPAVIYLKNKFVDNTEKINYKMSKSNITDINDKQDEVEKKDTNNTEIQDNIEEKNEETIQEEQTKETEVTTEVKGVTNKNQTNNTSQVSKQNAENTTPKTNNVVKVDTPKATTQTTTQVQTQQVQVAQETPVEVKTQEPKNDITTNTTTNTVTRISEAELNTEISKYLSDIQSIKPGLKYVYAKRGQVFWPYRTSEISTFTSGFSFGTIYYYVETFMEGNQEKFKYYIDWAGN